MNIGIDGNEANVAMRVGVNKYAFEVIRNLKLLQEKGEFNHNLIVYLKNKPLPDMPEENGSFKYRVIPGGGLWIITKLTPYLMFNEKELDIFFTPSHYVPFFVPIPKVCSIMDLGYLEFSAQFPKKVFWQLKWWSAISIYVSKRIISISNSTAKDIVRHYPLAAKKVSVIHLGYDNKQFNTNISPQDVRRIKDKYSIVRSYIIYIGTLKPSKNIEGLITSFPAVLEKYPDITLVIAGKKGWLFDEIFKTAEKLGINKNIIFTDFVAEEDKAPLIRGAKVLVIPSFWEGFGLDALNAMASGVPVVASSAGSLPEVVGDAGVVVDPSDPKSISAGLIRVLSMSKTDYNSLIALGLKQAGKFSWEATARQTAKILEEIK